MVLNVSPTASETEIKRSFVALMRQYEGNKEKQEELNEAANVLLHPNSRKAYDIKVRYGNRIEELKGKLSSDLSDEERERCIQEIYNISLKIIAEDPDNTDALHDLCEVCILRKDSEKLLGYLSRYLSATEKDPDEINKLSTLGYIADKYYKLDKTDEAVNVLKKLCEYDKKGKCFKDILALARIYYEEKKELKQALVLLNDSAKKSDSSVNQAVYYCECYRALSCFTNADNAKLKNVIVAKILSYKNTDEDNKRRIENYLSYTLLFDLQHKALDETCLSIMSLCLQFDSDSFRKLTDEANSFIKFKNGGKYHEAIRLYISEEETLEIRLQFNDFIFSDYTAIYSSLEQIEKVFPSIWLSNEKYQKFKAFLEREKDFLSQCEKFNRNMLFDKSLKTIVNYMYSPFIDHEEVSDQFKKALESFFHENNRKRAEWMLNRIQNDPSLNLLWERMEEDFHLDKGNQIQSSGTELVRAERTIVTSGNVSSNSSSSENPILDFLAGAGLVYIIVSVIGAIVLTVGWPVFAIAALFWGSNEDKKNKKFQVNDGNVINNPARGKLQSINPKNTFVGYRKKRGLIIFIPTFLGVILYIVGISDGINVGAVVLSALLFVGVMLYAILSSNARERITFVNRAVCEVSDKACLLSPKEIDRVMNICRAFANRTGYSVNILTRKKINKITVEEYVRTYFEHEAEVLEANANGIVILFTLNPQTVSMDTFGTAEKDFPDKFVDSVLDSSLDYLYDDNYTDAINAILGKLTAGKKGQAL